MGILFLRKAIFSGCAERPKEVPARPWKKDFMKKDYFTMCLFLVEFSEFHLQ
jgi:hypothetical protein